MRTLHPRHGLWLSLSVGCASWFGACGSDFSAVTGDGGAADTAGQGGENIGGSVAVAGTGEGGVAEGGALPNAGQGNTPNGAGAGAGGEQGGAAPTEPTFRQTILDAQPLVYWRMGAAKDRVVADETGGGNDLVLQGQGQQLGVEGAIEGDPDTAILFDGVASFAIATDARALDFANGAKFTLECWARWQAGGDSYFQHLFSNVAGVSGNRDGFALYVVPAPAANDSARSVFEYDRPAADLGVWGSLVDMGKWGHYVSVFDGKQAALYVNGTLAGSEVTAGSIAARTVPFTIGRAAGVNGSYFKGALDELVVYARPLTSAEIVQHFGFTRAE